ncbi:hypothetical protein EV715DRAFT_294021 [Schizophyllum commune]
MVRQKKAVKRKPGRKPWASGTKLAFLERHLDDFHRTPQKHRGRLYDRVALKFRAKYGADFNYDKDDLEEDTPDPTTFPYEQDTTNMTEEEAERSDAYFDRLRDKIQIWFRHVSTTVEATPVERIERILTDQQPSDPKSKKYTKLRIQQFYSCLHYDERVKPRFEETWVKEVAAWEEKLAAWKAAGVDVPADQAAPVQVAVRTRVTDACWDAESAPFQARVRLAQEEEEKQFYAALEAAAAAAAAPRAARTAEDYMRAIDAAPGYTQPFSDALGNNTGCCVAVLVAGPMPRQGGKIGMLSIHTGVISGVAEYQWPEWDTPGFESTESSFIGFAENVFGPATKAARSVLEPGKSAMLIMDKDPDHDSSKIDADPPEQPILTRLHRREGQGPVLRGVNELFTPQGSPAPEDRPASSESLGNPSEFASPAESETPQSQRPCPSPPREPSASLSEILHVLIATNKATSSPDAPDSSHQTTSVVSRTSTTATSTSTPPHPASSTPSRPASQATEPPTSATTSPLATPAMSRASTPAPPPSAHRTPASTPVVSLSVMPDVHLATPDDHTAPHPEGASGRTPSIPDRDPDVANGEAHTVWTKGVPGDASKHVQDMLAACARGRRWGFAFADALDSFIAFERALGFPDKNGGRPVFVAGLRPPVYTEWLQARRPYDRIMSIGDVALFRQAWWKWWAVMQPSTRTSASGELLALEALYVNPLHLDQMNGMHLCCGKDGLIQFLVALLWWGDAVNGMAGQSVHVTEQWVDWETAVLDFRDLLVLLVQTPGFDAHARASARDCHAARATRLKVPGVRAGKRARAADEKEDTGRRLRSSKNDTTRKSKRRKVAQ